MIESRIYFKTFAAIDKLHDLGTFKIIASNPKARVELGVLLVELFKLLIK